MSQEQQTTEKQNTNQGPVPHEQVWTDKDWVSWQNQWEQLFAGVLKMPRSRQAALARTKLEESYMWAWNLHAEIQQMAVSQAQSEGETKQ